MLIQQKNLSCCAYFGPKVHKLLEVCNFNQ